MDSPRRERGVSRCRRPSRKIRRDLLASTRVSGGFQPGPLLVLCWLSCFEEPWYYLIWRGNTIIPQRRKCLYQIDLTGIAATSSTSPTSFCRNGSAYVTPASIP